MSVIIVDVAIAINALAHRSRWIAAFFCDAEHEDVRERMDEHVCRIDDVMPLLLAAFGALPIPIGQADAAFG